MWSQIAKCGFITPAADESHYKILPQKPDFVASLGQNILIHLDLNCIKTPNVLGFLALFLNLLSLKQAQEDFKMLLFSVFNKASQQNASSILQEPVFHQLCEQEVDEFETLLHYCMIFDNTVGWKGLTWWIQIWNDLKVLGEVKVLWSTNVIRTCWQTSSHRQCLSLIHTTLASWQQVVDSINA